MSYETIKADLKKTFDDIMGCDLVQELKTRPVRTLLKAAIVLWVAKQLYKFITK